jgi:hypothetical protein
MPKKVIQEEIYNPEPELEVEEKPIKISKRTGKPVRPMTEKQKENLTKGRQIAIEKKKELNAGVDLERKARMIKEARNIRQQEKIAQQKKMYEDAVKEDADDEEVIQPKKEKKKKKVVKYIEESSSDSEEEEIIYKQKKKIREKTTSELEENVAKNELKKRLEDVRSSSLSQMLMPSYY